jgi:hypothetical protein
VIENHLRPAFGHLDLARLSRSPETSERYAADKLADGLSPKTIRNHHVLAGLMFKTARRWRWVSENPLDLVEPPPMPGADTETLTPGEVAELVAAYRVLAADAADEEQFWFDGPQNDRRGSLNGFATRRTARVEVEGR